MPTGRLPLPARPLPAATVLGRLVPPTAPGSTEVPEGFTLLDSDLRQGLPARFPLTSALVLTLVLPSGVARAWLRSAPDDVVTSSERPGADLPGAQLVLRADGRFAGSVPLTAGLTRLLPADPALPARLALRLLSWQVPVACVVGAGTAGAWLRLAWRTVDGAADVAGHAPRRPSQPVAPDAAVGYLPVAAPATLRDWR